MTTSNEWLRLTDAQRDIISSNQQELPIKLGDIAKSLGLIVKKSTLAAGISGEIKKSGDTFIIRVNRHDVKARQRFTVAHEIAHFLLHQDKIGDGIVDDILYRSSLSDDLEAEANRLAADIVMPWKRIKDQLNVLAALRLEEKIERLSELAEVSTTAIKIRLGKL
jgi:Zn-dependent peptidase ImmA (M78 family)